MACAVCGATTTGQSTICSSCDQVVGRGRFADTGGYYSPASRRPADVAQGAAAIWFVILFAITAGSALVTVGRPTDPYTSGEFFGNILAHIFLAAIISGLLRWTAKARYWRTFLITWAILIPLMFISSLTQRSEHQRQDLHQVALDLKKAMDTTNPSNSSSAVPTVNATPSSDGSPASPLQNAFQHITQNAMVFKQQEAARMQTEKDLHIELVLQPQRLVSAEGIAQSRSSLDQYRTLLTERQAALKALEDQNQTYLMQLPEPTQDAVLRGYVNARMPADQAFEQYFNIENSTIDTFNQVLDVAQKALGRSRLDKNGKLLLPEPMHGEMISLSQTIQQEVSEETAAKQTVQNLVTQQQQNVDQLLQETAAPGSPQ
jgi:hypothetical protein